VPRLVLELKPPYVLKLRYRNESRIVHALIEVLLLVRKSSIRSAFEQHIAKVNVALWH